MPSKNPLTIFLTGGARGIGRGLTRHLLQTGHRVFIIDSNAPELHHTSDLAKQWANPDVKDAFRSCVVDLKDRKSVREVVNGELQRWCDGRLNVLINNAMPTPHVWRDGKRMEDFDGDGDGEEDAVMQEWDEKIAVGLTAPFLLARLCVAMLQRSEDGSDGIGCVINISSTRAYQAEPDHEAYSAVKAGILGLTQSMAVSLGERYKIRVNAIIPGWIHVQNENQANESSDWTEGLSSQDDAWHPAGRVGKVEDICKAVEFLIASEFVTGQEIVVDGGVTRKMVYPE